MAKYLQNTYQISEANTNAIGESFLFSNPQVTVLLSNLIQYRQLNKCLFDFEEIVWPVCHVQVGLLRPVQTAAVCQDKQQLVRANWGRGHSQLLAGSVQVHVQSELDHFLLCDRQSRRRFCPTQNCQRCMKIINFWNNYLWKSFECLFLFDRYSMTTIQYFKNWARIARCLLIWTCPPSRCSKQTPWPNWTACSSYSRASTQTIRDIVSIFVI